jgi:hypothetical protein
MTSKKMFYTELFFNVMIKANSLLPREVILALTKIRVYKGSTLISFILTR